MPYSNYLKAANLSLSQLMVPTELQVGSRLVIHLSITFIYSYVLL